VDLLKIAEVGGRLGVAKEDIKAFTQEVDKANVALGDGLEGGVEQVTNTLGKLQGLYRETKDLNISTAINQIVNDEKPLPIPIHTLEYAQIPLMIMIIAGDADGIHKTDAQLTRHQGRGNQTTATDGDDSLPLGCGQLTASQTTGFALQIVP
jgi:hypothetical protein